jgi:hypothetical protein
MVSLYSLKRLSAGEGTSFVQLFAPFGDGGCA